MEMANSHERTSTQTSFAQELDHLKHQFIAYRKGKLPGQRIPSALRRSVLVALEKGVPVNVLQRICKITPQQIMYWQKSAPPSSCNQEVTLAKPRVLSVIPPARGEGLPNEVELSLRIGSWRICLSLDDRQP